MRQSAFYYHPAAVCSEEERGNKVFGEDRTLIPPVSQCAIYEHILPLAIIQKIYTMDNLVLILLMYLCKSSSINLNNK